MADEKAPSAGPFDVATVRELVRLMRKFDLSEVNLQDGDKRMRLRRGSVAPPPLMPLAASPSVLSPTAAAPPTPAAPIATPQAAVSNSRLVEIKSPMVGTFYSKPSPDKDDFVKVGARINAETVVCKIEAMKIFNDLPAGVVGIVAEICIQNGGFVEFDQVLFRVEPS